MGVYVISAKRYKIRLALNFLRIFSLTGCFQHVFDEDAVAGGGVIDQDVGDGADEVSVLDNGRAGHADVK